MRKQDVLQELIQELSPNEIGYFRRYSSIQPGEKKYMELFDLLEKNKIHTTQSLCAELEIKPARLAVTKHYLYHLLLRSLRNFEENATPQSMLTNSIEEAKLFVRKRMYAHALDIVEATLKKALALEAFEMVDDLLKIKYACINNNYMPDKMQEVVDLHKKTAEVKDELMELMNLAFLSRKIEIQREKKSPETEKIMDNPLMKKNPGEFKSFRARIEWSDIMFDTLFPLNEKLHECEAMIREEVKYYEKNPHIISISYMAWMSCLNRLYYVEYKLKNYADALKAADKFAMELNSPQATVSASRKANLYMSNKLFRAHVLLQLFDFENAVAASEELQELVKTATVYEQYSALYLHAVALVHLQSNKEANQKINELLQLKTDARKDIQPYARVLQIMAHVNSGKMDVIPYLVESAKVWMKRNKYVNKEIDLFFKHILAIARAPRGRAAWLKLKEDIAAGKFELSESELLIGRWVEKKPGK